MSSSWICFVLMCMNIDHWGRPDKKWNHQDHFRWGWLNHRIFSDEDDWIIGSFQMRMTETSGSFQMRMTETSGSFQMRMTESLDHFRWGWLKHQDHFRWGWLNHWIISDEDDWNIGSYLNFFNPFQTHQLQWLDFILCTHVLAIVELHNYSKVPHAFFFLLCVCVCVCLRVHSILFASFFCFVFLFLFFCFLATRN